MTPTQKIIALAELEGWELFRPNVMIHTWGDNKIHEESHIEGEKLQRYLTSHDALQPLLEKMTEKEWDKFDDATVPFIRGRRYFPYYAKFYLKLTPEQKADCILKACGKWEEQGG